MRKVVFLGDLTDCNNYGAIATTEALKKMLSSLGSTYEFKYIQNYRMQGQNQNGKSNVTAVLKKLVPIWFKQLYKKIIPSRRIDFVPYRLDQYESFYEKMQTGKSFCYEKGLLEWCDILFINGEGTVVHGIDQYGRYRLATLYWFFMAWVAKVKYKKKVYVVNHIVDPDSSNAIEIIKELYPKLDAILVRDPFSKTIVEQLTSLQNVRFVPDALFSYKPINNSLPKALIEKIDISKPFICIGDSSGIRNNYHKVQWDVVKVFDEIIKKLKELVPQVVFIDGFNEDNTEINKVIRRNNLCHLSLKNCNYHELYQVFAHASVFISGRWHASILSILANTPIVLWGADSHKTRSLYSIINYKYPFYNIAELPANIDSLVNTVSDILNNNMIIRTELKTCIEPLVAASKENVAVLTLAY